MTVPKQWIIILKVDVTLKCAFFEGIDPPKITQEVPAILIFGFEYFVQRNISNLLDLPLQKNLLI